MPRVQGEVPQSTIKPLSTPEMPRTPSLAAFSGGGQGMAAFGQGLGQLAGNVFDIGLMQGEAEAKQAEVEFSNQIRDLLHNGENGYFAQRGKNAVDKTATVQSQIATLREQHSKNLSGYARKAFDESSTRRVQMSLEQVANHNLRETQAWHIGESQARIDNLITDAVTNYVNPLQANEYLAAAEKEMMTLSRQQGFDTEQTKNAMGRMRSTFARGVLERVAQNKPEMLEAYFQKFSGSLQGNDAAQIDHMVSGIRQKQKIGAVSYALLQNSTKPNLAAADGLVQAMITTESSGNPNAVSSKGALGLMQIMPETGREIHGKLKATGQVDGEFSPERLKDPNYNMTLGREYINQQLGKYQGNSLMALAAYNWGPGRVDALVQKLGGLGNFSNEEFYNALPDGHGKEGYKPENDVKSYIRKTLGTVPMGEAEMTNLAVTVAEGNFDIARAGMSQYNFISDAQEKQQKEAQKAVVNQWSLHIVKGGRFDDIDPVSLSVMGDDGQRRLLELWEKRQSVQGKADGDNQFKALIGLRAQNPDEFANANLMDIAPNLSLQQWQAMTASQEKINAGGYVESAADKATKDWIKGNGDLLRGAGIDPASNKGEKKKERDLFTGRLVAEISTFMDANNKRKPNQKELNQIASTLLEETNKGWFGSDKIYEVDTNSLSATGLRMAETILDLSGQPSLRATFGAQKRALDSLQNARKITQDITGKPLSDNNAAAAAAALLVMPREQFEAYMRAGADPQSILDAYRMSQ